MVKISDIEDRDSLKAWLEDQPREVSVWIASRAAARALPLWWQAVLTKNWARKGHLTAPVLRSVLTASVAALVPTDDIRAAAGTAAAAAARNAAARTATAAARTAAARTAAAAAAAAADALLRPSSSVTWDSSSDTYQGTHADADAAWAAVRADAEQVAGGGIPDAMPLWPDGQNPFEKEWPDIKAQVQASPDIADWQFWLDWYDAQLAGRTLLPDPARTWQMLEQIALIDRATWDKGPEVVNPVIREIWEGYRNGGSYSDPTIDPETVSEDAKSAMKQRVAVNRDALAVASAGLMDQLDAYRDRVRGMNHLEPEVREEVLAFIDEVTGKLSALLEGLPRPGEAVSDARAGQLVLWLREYRVLLRHKLAYYGSVENMAEATVPTGIILVATGVGAMMGMPVTGSIVGGLIVNQMKPGQAARELTKPTSKDGEAG